MYERDLVEVVDPVRVRRAARAGVRQRCAKRVRARAASSDQRRQDADQRQRAQLRCGWGRAGGATARILFTLRRIARDRRVRAGMARRGRRSVRAPARSIPCGHALAADRHLHGSRAGPLGRLGPAGDAAAAQLHRRDPARRRRRADAAARPGASSPSPICVLDVIDGLLLAGGADVDPELLRRAAGAADGAHRARARRLRDRARAARDRARHPVPRASAAGCR